MGLVGAGKDTEDGDEVVHVYCSICLNAVKCGGDRSTAKLQCGHEFHLGQLHRSIPLVDLPSCYSPFSSEIRFGFVFSRRVFSCGFDGNIPSF